MSSSAASDDENMLLQPLEINMESSILQPTIIVKATTLKLPRTAQEVVDSSDWTKLFKKIGEIDESKLLTVDDVSPALKYFCTYLSNIAPKKRVC